MPCRTLHVRGTTVETYLPNAVSSDSQGTKMMRVAACYPLDGVRVHCLCLIEVENCL
jgi:hypothetical protein